MLSDDQKSTLLLELVAERHQVAKERLEPSTKALAHREVFLTEVSNGTGVTGPRANYGDALAVSLWPSDGFTCVGYEIKASRSDLKRELALPDKWRGVGRYCSQWWLVVWSAKMLDGLVIPPEWGVLAYEDEGLRRISQAPTLTPTPWTRPFIAALLRRAAESSPGGGLLEYCRLKGYKDGHRHGRAEVNGEVAKALAPLLADYCASEPWRVHERTVPVAWAVQRLVALLDAERAP